MLIRNHGGDDRVESIPFDMLFEFDEDTLRQKQLAGEPCLPADNEVVHRLGSEMLSQVFSFYVEGAMKWYKTRCLPKPYAIKLATSSLLSNNDSVQQFINECCEIGEDLFEPSSPVFERYQAWFDANEVDAVRLRKQAFNAAMEKSKGFKKGCKWIQDKTVMVFKGFRFKKLSA